MNQESIIEILESNGFQGRKVEGGFKECTIYEQESTSDFQIDFQVPIFKPISHFSR